MVRLGRFDKDGYKNSFSKGELARELVYMNKDYDNLEQQVKKQKEVIDKAIEYIDKEIYYCLSSGDNINIYLDKLLDILKEVSK